MNKSKNLFLLILFVLCCFGFPSQAQHFEGIIYYEMPDLEDENITELNYMVKGPKTRIEFGNQEEKGAMLFLPEESRIIILVDAQKGFISMDATEGEDEMDNYSDVDAIKTGETKTIAGKQCEVWNVTSEKNQIEACVAKGIGTFMMPQNPMAQKNMPQWAKEFMEDGAMPLEVIEITNGSRSVQMLAKRIEEKSLSSDLFTIPEGYQDMSAMMRQMQELQ